MSTDVSMAVQIERRGHVGVILLDQADTHHALSRAIVMGVLAALRDPRIQTARALVISSTGPSFCAGANINDLLDGWMAGQEPETDPVQLFQTLAQDPRPTIAAVDGAAVGGGFELMLSCDLAVASHAAWFALPELGHGVIPNTALMRLQQIIGLRGLYAFMMTGQRVNAQQALTMGLVNSVCEPGQALDEAVLLAQQIVNRVAPGALAVAKRYAQAFAATDWARVQAALVEVPSEQWQEGLNAFTEKRRADFEPFW